MNVTRVDAARLEREWPFFAEKLWPAVRQDPNCTMQAVHERLLSGTALLMEVHGEADGLWVIALDEDSGLVAWTFAIAGAIAGGPKARVATIRRAVSALETTLKAAGVKAHRICGRDWSAILPDYSPFDGARNGIEKVL